MKNRTEIYFILDSKEEASDGTESSCKFSRSYYAENKQFDVIKKAVEEVLRKLESQGIIHTR